MAISELAPKRHPRVLSSDFDGTIANTLEQTPGIIDVNEAYLLAFKEKFGPEGAEWLTSQGGHNNRTALEMLRSFRPMTYDDTLRLAEEINRIKLEILVGQIGTVLSDGTMWPTPIGGFCEAWTELIDSRGRIATALVNAGHSKFIGTWFGKFNLPSPDVMITQDTINSLRMIDPPVKPNPVVMKLAFTALAIPDDTPNVYVGDDPRKDGQLARNTGAEFVLIAPDSPHRSWEKAAALVRGSSE